MFVLRPEDGGAQRQRFVNLDDLALLHIADVHLLSRSDAHSPALFQWDYNLLFGGNGYCVHTILLSK